MPRPPRVLLPGGVYHVTTRGNAGSRIYVDDVDRERFLGLCVDVVERFGWRCHAYCLMSNHYHLLLETPEPNLPLGLSRLNSLYARSFNRDHRRSGHVFGDRYFAIVVERESHLLEVARYVVLNPVRAGICRDPADWPWSSYAGTAGLTSVPALLTVDWLLGQLAPDRGRAQERYRSFVAEAPGNRPWRGLSRRIFLGVAGHAKPVPVPTPVRLAVPRVGR
jgi:putative transposase